MDSTLRRKKWNILGTTYTVKWVLELRNEHGEPLDGEIDLIHKEISLSDRLKNGCISATGLRHALRTLLHELFHGVQEESGLSQTDIDDKLFEVLSETSANFIVNNFLLEPIGDEDD